MGELVFHYRRHFRAPKMIIAVAPRPIAVVATVDEDGRINAASFSFSSCLSADSGAWGKNNPDMSFNNTRHNTYMSEVFTVNIVSFAMAEAMVLCASKYPHDLIEQESTAAFECCRHISLELGKSRQMILGEILFADYRLGITDKRLHADPAAL